MATGFQWGFRTTQTCQRKTPRQGHCLTVGNGDSPQMLHVDSFGQLADTPVCQRLCWPTDGIPDPNLSVALHNLCKVPACRLVVVIVASEMLWRCRMTDQ